MFNLAHAYHNGGDIDAAIQYGLDARSLAARAGWTAGEAKRLMNLGLCVMLSGRLPDAAGYLRGALDMPVAATWRYSTALPNLGVAQRLMGDFDAAAETFGQALSASNRDGTDLTFNHTEFAELCLDRGQFAEARTPTPPRPSRVIPANGAAKCGLSRPRR